MAKRGRPFAYQSDEEKPVTVSLRIPREVYAQVERYVKMHPGMTLTEFMLDGIRLRLDTPADPRDLILSDDNTVIQEVQEMIRTAVQAEIGKLSAFMQPHASLPGAIPTPEAPAEPVPALSHDHNTVMREIEETATTDAPGIVSDDNTVLQEVGAQEQRAPESVPAPTKRTRGTMRERILTLLAEHAEGLGAEEIRAYLKPAKPLGDTLQGMRRNGVVKTRGTGKDTRYFVGEEHSDGSPTAPDHEQSGSH